MEHPSTGDIAKLTVIGSVFAGVGALLNAYVPVFHVPVTWVDRALHKGCLQLENMPGFDCVFKQNPLTSHKMLREFMAVNIVETAMIGSAIVTVGAALKLGGIKPHQLRQWLASGHGVDPPKGI